MTDAEMLLWSKLRGKQLKGGQFYRQKIIDTNTVISMKTLIIKSLLTSLC